MRLKTILFSITLVFGAAIAEESKRQWAVQSELGEERRRLKTNTPAVIYAELHNPILPLQIAKKASLEISNAFEIIVGGDDNNCSVVLTWPQSSEIAHTKFLKYVTRYVELRRAGLSTRGAVTLLEEPKDNRENKYSIALLKKNKWLPFPMLEKLKGRTVSFPWLDGEVFVFVDPEVRYLVRFDKNSEGDTTAACYALDPSEFIPANRESFERAERLAREELKVTESQMRYWRRLKVHLKEEGIEWISPDELNPETLWH
jgi:hypothetical protein